MRGTMEPGVTVTIKIDSIAFGGRGVGRVEGVVVFVPHAAPGDVLSVVINGVRKRYCEGTIQRILSPSPHRITPVCRYYGRCGGCHYQHLDYPEELRQKERQVVETFVRIGGISSPPVRPMIPSEQIYHYRGKAEYHLRHEEDGACRIGFIDDESRALVDVERCEIVDESINDAFRRFRMGMDGGASPAPARMVFWSGTEDRSLRTITRRVKEKEFLVPRGGFFQTNLSLTGRLVDTVLAMAGPGGHDALLDCYCGVGLFSLCAAPSVSRVSGCDSDGPSIECARENASRLGVVNAAFIARSVEDTLRGACRRRREAYDVVLLDPPRAGCTSAVLEGIATMRPRTVVYVSCHPATQARDAKVMMDNGYTLAALQPVDMFPRTKHIEVVALFTSDVSGPHGV